MKRLVPVIGLLIAMLLTCGRVSAYLTTEASVSWHFRVMAYSINDATVIPTDTGYIVTHYVCSGTGTDIGHTAITAIFSSAIRARRWCEKGGIKLESVYVAPSQPARLVNTSIEKIKSELGWLSCAYPFEDDVALVHDDDGIANERERTGPSTVRSSPSRFTSYPFPLLESCAPYQRRNRRNTSPSSQSLRSSVPAVGT